MKFRVIPCLLATSLTIISAFLFRVSSVHAQQIGLSISPPLLEVMIQPGKTITQAYQVTNNSDYDLYLVPKIVPFSPSDLHGGIFLDLSHTVRGALSEQLGVATSFFSLQNKDIDFNQPFMLPAGRSQQLVLRANIPEDNQEKDYYYTFLIEQSDRELHIGQGESRHQIKIGSNLLITVSESGEPTINFQVTEFEPKPKFGDTFDTVKFKLVIENTGQAFFKPEGTIEIYHTLLNRKMAELELLPENILVHSARELRCQYKDTSEVYLITPCQFSSWLPGRYKAVISDPGAKIPELSATYFYLIPYRLILSLIILSLIIWQIKEHQKLDK